MGTFYNPKIITDGIVLHLDAANKKSYPGSGTTWYDLSKNKKSGTLTNGPTYSSVSGGCLNFNGTNQYVITSLDGTSLSNVSVGFYMYITSNGSVFQWANSLSAGVPWILFNYNTGNQYRLYVNGNYRINVNLYTLTWYNVYITYSSNLWSLYINSILIGTYSGGFTNQSNAISVYLANGYNSYFGGNISCCQIYNKALSANEILQNFNATKSRYGL